MSKINAANITYPYINIKLPDEESAEKRGVNLSRLYLYIDEHKIWEEYFHMVMFIRL